MHGTDIIETISLLFRGGAGIAVQLLIVTSLDSKVQYLLLAPRL